MICCIIHYKSQNIFSLTVFNFNRLYSIAKHNSLCSSDNGIVRYKGMCKDGMLHGEGTLYTKSGTLIFEGEFENNMVVEGAAEREARAHIYNGVRRYG